MREKAPTPSSLRDATSPPVPEGEEGRELAYLGSLPQQPTGEVSGLGSLPRPPLGGEVAARSDDGVGGLSRSRRRPGTTSRAKSLRQNDNQAEALLWLDLKNSQLGGYKFTRQLPIGPYFADFCCRKVKLVVELDGSQHADSTSDRRRDEFMRTQGYSILRLWSHEVIKHRTSVCETILAALNGELAEDVIASDLRFVFARGSR